MRGAYLMYGKVLGACLHGIDGKLIEVETDLSNGLPMVNVVGLPDSAIRESVERVRAAIKNCGFTFPLQRITINLAPADLRKEGSAFDLAIAIGILSASGQLPGSQLEGVLILGELALDGSVRPVPGVLSMAVAARKHGITRIVVPVGNAEEALLIEGIELLPINRLQELKEAAAGDLFNPVTNLEHLRNSHPAEEPSAVDDYADVCGQLQAKRALMICAAGLHNVLFIGPPGTGKTMLMRRLPSILPDMTEEEALEVTKIYSAAGKLPARGQLIRSRPYRSPHHTISSAGLIGGGSIPKPGEASLSHHGVLFLDELPEFQRSVLEVMRQPLEDRQVTIGRARAVYTFPAQFILACSMNPCPCGYLGAESATRWCTCSPIKIAQYRNRISGPLLDRIDLHVEVPRIDYSALTDASIPLPSSTMKLKVLTARRLQDDRYKSIGIRYNGELSGKQLRTYCALQPSAQELLKLSFETLDLSIRAHDRILKIARTIADLEGMENIQEEHIAEALQYRTLDKQGLSDVARDRM
jgi:magnesium chelatase family protein